MANTTTEIFGFEDISFNTPATVAEIIALVGEDRVMELVLSGSMQSNANKVKTAFVKLVEDKTGEKRKTNPEGRITETGLCYIERMTSVLPDFAITFRPELEKLASEHSYSFARERAAVGEVKVPQKYINSIKYMFASVDLEGEPKPQTLERNLKKYFPEFDYSSLLDGSELTEEGAKLAAQMLRPALEKKERELAAAKSDI